MEYELAGPRGAIKAVGWRPVVVRTLLFSQFAVFGLMLGATGVLWDALQDSLRVGDGVFGSALLVTPLSGAVVLLAIGPLAAAVGKKRLAIASLALVAVAQWSLGIVGTLAAFVAVRALTGAGYGLLEGTINSTVLDWEQATARSTMNGMHAAVSIGSVAGALAAGAVLSAGWSYRQVLFVLALLTLLICVVTVLVRYPPRAPGAEAQSSDLRSTLRLFGQRPALARLALLGLLGAAAEALAAFWLVIYLRDLGATMLIGGGALALFNGTMFVGRLINGVIVARRGVHVSLVLSSAGVVAAAALLVSRNTPVAVVAFAILGLAVAGVFPTVLGAAGRLAPGDSASISGMILVAGFAGFVVAPPAIGWTADLIGLQAALLLTLGALGAVMLLILRSPAFLRP